jgi:hypothetical protein
VFAIIALRWSLGPGSGSRWLGLVGVAATVLWESEGCVLGYWYWFAWGIGIFIVLMLVSRWFSARLRARGGDEVDGVRFAVVVSPTIVHPAPAWGDRADGMVRGRTGSGWASRDEELPARQVGPASYELCCIPFVVTGLALGDIVEVDPAGFVNQVVEPSGRATFGALLLSGERDASSLDRDLAGSDVLVEWSSSIRLSLSMKSPTGAEALATSLDRLVAEGLIEYDQLSPAGPHP